jgi:hypothetical protein
VPTDPRRVYLDTEFLLSDPTTGGFVSVGLTDDAGHDYTAINAEMDAFHVYNHAWMRENVWPFLPTAPGIPHRLDYTHPDVKPLAEIKDEIAAYFDTGRETHLYAYYGGQDIFRLHSLWGHDWEIMPRQIPRWFFDIKALYVQAGSPEMPEQKNGAHDALDDARYNRTMHEHLLALEAEHARETDIARLHGEDGEDRVYQVVGGWGVDGADDEAHARRKVEEALAQYPHCGAHAQWRTVRTWDDGAEYYGPWNALGR